MKTFSDLEQDQLDTIEFIDSGEDTLLCADIGTGKTVIALTAAADALRGIRFNSVLDFDHDYCEEMAKTLPVCINRWLVLAPLLVATDTWAIEPTEWEHLQHLNIKIACGDEKQRLAAINSDAEIVVMNYENLAWLLETFPKPRSGKPDPLPFDGLIADEIDKLKEVSSARFKALRNRIKTFRKRICMTGTLVPNKLTELWGQTYMVDGGHTFGRSFYDWRKKYFYPADYNQHKWAPFSETRDILIDKLSGLAYRLKAVGMPELVMMPPATLELPDSVRPKYDELEDEYIIQIPDEKKRLREVEAANAAVLQGKLQQICAGFSYVDRTKEAVWHSYDRFDWYDDLYQGLGEQILVFYHFNEELAELKRRYPQIHHLGKGVSNKQARATIKRWNEGNLTQLALHPASAGHGLNLQKSGAHHIALLTQPWSGGLFNQLVGRLRRRGNTAEKIFIHTALFKDTVDEEVQSSLDFRIEQMHSFLDDLGG